jgi:hypothetical protein
LAYTTTNLLTYTKNSLSAGTLYTFWVAAENFIGVGALSPPVTQRAASVPSKPDAPTITATYNSLALTWTAPNNGGLSIDTYKIYWDPDGNVSDDFEFLDSTSNLFYTINSGIVQGTTYKFRIVAHNEIGDSTSSDVASALAASAPS